MAGSRKSIRTTARAALMLVVTAAIVALAFVGIRFFIPPPLNEMYSPREISYFKALAFGVEPVEFDLACATRGDCVDQANRVRKWETDIRLWLTGEFTVEDRDELRQIASELDDLIPTLSVEVTDDRLAANVIVGFTPRADLSDAEDHPLGFVMPRSDGWTLNSAAIFVDSSQGLPLRLVILRHEVMHALGFPLHAPVDLDSVLFIRPASEIRQLRVYPAIDNAVIRLLYESRILPGMTLLDLNRLGL